MEVMTEVVGSQWAVRLTATGYSGTVTWWEDTGPDVRLIGTGPILIDRALRLNHPTTYFATDDTATVVADPVTVPAAAPVLASTTTGAAEPVTVVDWRPYSGQGQSVWHPVLGRMDPVVTVHPMLYPSARIRLRAATWTERVRILQMLAPGDPLLLRTVCPERLDTMTMLVTGWEDPFVRDDARSGPSYIELEVQRVTDLPGITPPPADRTYGTIAASGITYGEVAEQYVSYQAFQDGVPA